MSSKKCPKCGLLNHETAVRCDCGYDFPSGELKESYLSQVRTAHIVTSQETPQHLAGLVLKNSLIRLLKGAAGIWTLGIVIIPYGLKSDSLGMILSGLLFIVLYGLVVWDFKKGTRKSYPYVKDGLIFLCVGGVSGGIMGVAASISRTEFYHPWWLGLLSGFGWFVFLEVPKVYRDRSSIVDRLKNKIRWFFPVDTTEDTLDAIKIAYCITAVVAGIKLIGIGLLILLSGRLSANIFDPIFLAAIAWILKTRRSRTVAVILLLYSVILGFMTLAARLVSFTGFGLSIVLAVTLIFGSYKGIQGTFGYHRLKGTSIHRRNLIKLSLIILAYFALYTVGIISLFVVPQTSVWVNQLSDEKIGMLLLLPLIAILFLGGYRYLPGTKSFIVVMAAPETPERTFSRGYIAKHWRGELTLAQSCFVNVLLVLFLFFMAFKAINLSDLYSTNLLFATQIYSALFLLSIPVTIWQFGGCWRAARKYRQQTGKVFWPAVVQLLIVLGVLADIGLYKASAPTIVEYVKIATRTEDFTDYEINVLENGSVVEISGSMAFGIDENFKKTLEEHPNISIVHLNSIGGRLSPARKLSNLIEKNQLTTYVAEQCYSACLLPFMAGKSRILNTKAKLGFHRYSFPGSSKDYIRKEVSIDRQYFTSRGISKTFLDRVFRTKASTLWFPTMEELISNGVITQSYDGKNIEKQQ